MNHFAKNELRHSLTPFEDKPGAGLPVPISACQGLTDRTEANLGAVKNGSYEIMQTVVETSIFRRRAEKLLSEKERRALIDFLAWNPDAG